MFAVSMKNLYSFSHRVLC